MNKPNEILLESIQDATIPMRKAEMCMRVYAVQVLRELEERLKGVITEEIHEVEKLEIDKLIRGLP